MFNIQKSRSAVSLLLMFILLIGFGGQVSAEQASQKVDVYFVPMHFVFDGTQLAPPSDQQGFIYEGSTYVPLRFIAYSLNKAVQWDGDTYTVSIVEPNQQDKAVIDDYKVKQAKTKKLTKVDTSQLSRTGIHVYPEKVTYVFDGMTKQPAVNLPGFIYENRLYVPMRFFSEAVGKKIEWDPVSYTVSAQTEAGLNSSGKSTLGSNDSKSSPTPVPTPTPIVAVNPTASPVVTPTPAPSLVSGGGVSAGAGGAGQSGGGGGSEGAAAKPSYEGLKSSADASISALKSKAESALTNLVFQVIAETDPQKRTSLISQGNAMISGYDAEFASILGALQSALLANGYETSIIPDYQQKYNAEKQQALSVFGK